MAPRKREMVSNIKYTKTAIYNTIYGTKTAIFGPENNQN